MFIINKVTNNSWRCLILQFSVGQKIIHPGHGLGEIVDVTEIDLVDGFHNYYVIEFANRLILHIPVRKMDDLGIRKTMSEAKVEDVLNTLRDTPHRLPDDYKDRHQKVEAWLHSGHPVEIAKAVRELAWREACDGLSKTDGGMLSKGKSMLATEIALVTDHDLIEAHQEISKALDQAISTKQAQIDFTLTH